MEIRDFKGLDCKSGRLIINPQSTPDSASVRVDDPYKALSNEVGTEKVTPRGTSFRKLAIHQLPNNRYSYDATYWTEPEVFSLDHSGTFVYGYQTVFDDSEYQDWELRVDPTPGGGSQLDHPEVTNIVEHELDLNPAEGYEIPWLLYNGRVFGFWRLSTTDPITRYFHVSYSGSGKTENTSLVRSPWHAVWSRILNSDEQFMQWSDLSWVVLNFNMSVINSGVSSIDFSSSVSWMHKINGSYFYRGSLLDGDFNYQSWTSENAYELLLYEDQCPPEGGDPSRHSPYYYTNIDVPEYAESYPSEPVVRTYVGLQSVEPGRTASMSYRNDTGLIYAPISSRSYGVVMRPSDLTDSNYYREDVVSFSRSQDEDCDYYPRMTDIVWKTVVAHDFLKKPSGGTPVSYPTAYLLQSGLTVYTMTLGSTIENEYWGFRSMDEFQEPNLFYDPPFPEDGYFNEGTRGFVTPTVDCTLNKLLTMPKVMYHGVELQVYATGKGYDKDQFACAVTLTEGRRKRIKIWVIKF